MTPQRHAPAPVTVRPALLPHLCGVGHAREGSLMDAGRVMMPILLLLAGLLDGTVCHGQDDWPAAQECLKRMTVPPGFDVKLFAAEPDVVNPIAIDFDHRGRMYVLEALQYPVKAPEDKQGLDRIRILEDTDGDHTADRVTLFADRLNLGSGIAVGHGGVFVLQPPYLLFLQDSDGDDRADRREVLLDGWGYADTHATANSLIFGPDGWLYGNQGFGNQSMVRGKTFHAGFWRYHPQSKGFEVFAEGTSNTWGLDYDEHGNFFASVSVIPHLYHVVPRAFHRHPRGYLWSNPHAYGEIDTVADHRHFPPPGFEGDVNDARFGGGHAHTGCLIYQGGAFPRKYHGRVFLNNLHGNRINSDVLARRGSSFTASHGPDFFLANDNNFHGIQLRTAPDGSVFVLDWYDSQICHNSDPDVWDRDYGRIYKIVYRESKQFGRADLSELPTAELVKLLRHDNSWWWRRALLILDERADRSAVEALKELVRRSSDDRHALRALWALHNLESLDEHFLRKTLAHDSGPVRGWSVRFLSEVPATELGSETWKSLMHLVRREPSADVRLELAVATQRWGGEADVRSESLLKLLMQRDEDADDPAISAMLWLGWEPIVAAAPQRALQWLLAHEAAHPMVRNPILPWSLRRLVESDNPELIKLDPSERRRDLVSTALAEDLNLAVATLARLKDSSALPAVLEAILTGLAGRRLEAPAAWPAAATELAKSPDAEVGNLSRRLGVHFGDPQAVSTFEQQAIETSLPKSQRLQAIDMLALARHALSVDSLLRTVLEDESVDIRTHALNAVAAFDDTKIARTLLANWSRLSPQLQQQTIRTLTGRKRSAHDVLHAIEQGVMQRQSLSEADARRIAEFHDPELNDKLERVWGKLRVTTPETISRALAELRERLETSSGDRTAGEAIFWKNCANCHKLNGRGHNVGPELTGANRRDPEYLLVNIIDPNRSVERSYAAAVILDVSGKVHTGLLVQQTPDRITLNGERGVVTILERYEVEELKLSEKSLMPEGLDNNLTPEQFGDLVAFLMEDLYLTKGLVSKRFPSSKPLDEKFAVESTPHPLRAAGAQWRPFHIGAAGRVEFDGRSSDRYRRPQEGCHYIYAEVAAHRDLDTEMVVGFETGLQIRVNDQVVYHQNSPAGYTPISRKSPIFIRSRIPETPVFEKMKATESFSKNPVGEVGGKNYKAFLIAVGLKLSEVSWVYMLTVFIVVYATTKLAMPKQLLLDAVMYAALFELITLPMFGWLSDKIVRRPLFILGAIFTMAFAFPLFWMLETKSVAMVTTAILIAMNFGHGMMFGLESTYFPKLFGSRVRYSGASFGFQVAAAIGGGFSPIVATALVGYFGGTEGVSVMMIGIALITLLAALAAKETKDEALMG